MLKAQGIICHYVLFCIAIALFSGCEDKRRHQASEHVEFPIVTPPVSKDAPPEDAALALLDAMKTLQSIRAVGFGSPGNKEKYDQAMGLIASLMDKNEVYVKVKVDRSPTIPKDIKQDAAVRLVAESWVSTSAHYLNGVEPSSKSVTLFKKGEPASGPVYTLKSDGSIQRNTRAIRETDEATVHVDATNAREKQLLTEIENSKELDGATGSDGKPLVKGSSAYLEKVRSLAIKQGFNVPIQAQIAISLIQTPEGWRAVQLWLQAADPQIAQSN